MNTLVSFSFWIASNTLKLLDYRRPRKVKNRRLPLIGRLRCRGENGRLFRRRWNNAKALLFAMEGAMRIICLLGAGVLATQGASAESLRAETCRKGPDVRVIEVISPGSVGLACDVVYSRDGGSDVAVPYNANVDKDFCRARAAELAANLIAEGFDCSTEASQSIEAALAGGEPLAAAADAPLDVQLKQLEIANDQPTDDASNGPGAPLEQPQMIAAAEPSAAAPVTAPAAQDVQEPAPAEPIQLAADARPSEFRAPRPSKATGPGRLVGAQPSIEDIIDVATAPKGDAGAAAMASESGAPSRTADEIIRGVLSANAAAWNEGNLEAFMGGYANSADLMMVKNAVVTTGWRDVRKAYEREIAASAGMGRLSFENIEVSLTSADVATVIGRYSLAQSDSNSTGGMTLVMKQIDGRWRIVQDTRVASAAPKL